MKGAETGASGGGYTSYVMLTQPQLATLVNVFVNKSLVCLLGTDARVNVSIQRF